MLPMPRVRFASRALWGLALAAACGEVGPEGNARVEVRPILDSAFVGQALAARTARYFDAQGESLATGPVRWSSADQAVFTVDSVLGTITAAGPGAALLSARANGVTGRALVIVTRALDLALLLDTIVLMPGDTFTVPVALRDQDGNPPPVWFDAPGNPAFSIDSASGRVTALVPGIPRPFTAHAETVTASGAVEVVELTDTTGGRSSFSILGTVIRRARAGARAVNYRRQGDTTTFRVSLPIRLGPYVVENTVITLRDSVNAPAPFAIDSISLAEAFGADFVCRPARAWAIWSILTDPPIRALSRHGGSLSITQVAAVPGGHAIGGRFSFTGRRDDFYGDTLAALPIRGTFVAPLIADPRPCS